MYQKLCTEFYDNDKPFASQQEVHFYEKFVLNHHLLHSQHVLDFIAKQKRPDELIRLNHNVLFSTTLPESIE